MNSFQTKTGGKKTVAVPALKARPRKANDELCGRPGCGHTYYYHLFGGKTCAYSESQCQCSGFVPTGRYYDFAANAERTKAAPNMYEKEPVTRRACASCSRYLSAAGTGHSKTCKGDASENPHTYGAGTRLSEAYTKGRDGLPLPPFFSEPGSAAKKAWQRGHDEYEKENS